MNGPEINLVCLGHLRRFKISWKSKWVSKTVSRVSRNDRSPLLDVNLIFS